MSRPKSNGALPAAVGTRTLELPTGGHRMWTQPGLRLANNALGALGAAIAAGLDPAELAHALTAADKTTTSEQGGVLLVDSCAEHPDGIATDLAAARVLAAARHGRLYVGYHPHGGPAPSLAIGRSLTAVDGAVVIPADTDEPGLADAQRVAAGSATVATAAKNRVLAIRALVGLVRPGDVLALIGADVEVAQLGDVVLERLATRGNPALVAGVD